MKESFIRYALDNAAIVATTDAHGTITGVNKKFCEISGYSKEELIGANHRILRSGIHHKEFFRLMYQKIKAGHIWHGEICNRRKNGSLYWVDTTIVPHLVGSDKVDGYVAIRFDITKKKELEEELQINIRQLEATANTDFLTDLPNRRLFSQYMEDLIKRKGEEAGTFHLAILDIDLFKEINDSFGHVMGDYLLKVIALRLRNVVDDHVFIARLGGDEFGIILDRQNTHDNQKLCGKILDAVREPVTIGSITHHFSASMGCAIFPQHGADAASLLQATDIALYRAKALGRDRFEVFSNKSMEAIKRKFQLLSDVNIGLRREEFMFFYQPILYPASHPAISFEALARWDHPQRGIIGPSDFHTALTDPATCAIFGLYLLEHVFDDMAIMRDKGLLFGRVAINLTNADFRSDAFLERFFKRCAQTAIGPEQFCVEVTETMLLGDDQKRVERGLRQLHDAGVEVALDDFGTGYASLTHLREFPIDRLKIDRRFVSNIETSPEDSVIVRGIINIAHGLGKTVTAEGIESTQQAKILLDMHCDSLQGWLFSRACRVEDLYSTIQKIPEILKTLDCKPLTKAETLHLT
ncbi:MAG: EAL domain-containing protein [Acetobacter sp.]|uniref:putative bifunctional diguanylate cyclase/phosphodiesterase n=1 Tax=Acetobacter sp. TaxID=440 RepID=UPI0039E91DD9